MSNTTQWGQVVGAVVGYFTGGVGYVAFGAAVGGLAGSLLEPTKKTESGRINDLKVSVSQYGAGIPETWGNNVPPATWIWATDIIELGTTQSSGKGGGVENTNYRQYIHGYISLGATPPAGSNVRIRKVWSDGKLTYDGSSGLSAAQALASDENPFTRIGLFEGREDQLPNSFIEFFEGIGNVPAYRGILGVLVTALECPGGRVPQLSFEICIDSVDTGVVLYGEPFFVPNVQRLSYSSAPTNSDPITVFAESGRSVPGYATDEKIISIHALGLDYLTYIDQFAQTNQSANYTALRVGNSDIEALCFRGVSALNLTDSGKNIVFMKDGSQKTFDVTALAFGQGNSSWSKFGNRFIICGDNGQSSDIVELFDWDTSNRIGIVPGLRADSLFISASTAWVFYVATGVLRVQARSLVDFSLIADQVAPVEIAAPAVRSCTASESALVCFSRTTSEASLWNISLVSNVIQFERTQQRSIAAPTTGEFGPIGLSGDMVVGVRNTQTFLPEMFVVRFGSVTPAEVDVSQVIISQSSRVDLETRIDVSDVVDTVFGYTANKSPSSARSNIAPLFTYSGVMTVEEDGLIRFKMREGQSPVLTLPYDELGSTEAGQDPSDPFPLTRAQEVECPRSVTVQYVNPTFDYQTSTETAQRIVTDSELDETVTLDVAMMPDRAATLAHRILYERWLSRNSRTAKISRRFAALSPGDVVTIEYPQGILGNYMLAKVTDTGAMVEIECTPSDAELLTQTVPGTNGYTPQELAALPPPTLATVIDSRILRDADNNAGLYVAMGGYGPGWIGSELWAGLDEDSLSSRGGVTDEAVQGVCETLLTDYFSGNVDEQNLLAVNVNHSSLETITRDALLNGTSNTAVVGAPGRWEVIRFQRATSSSGGRYILSGLLRGLQGSEYAMAQHQVGDRFVLMSGAGGVLRPIFDAGSIGQEIAFKAVSVGRRFDSAGVQESLNTGEGLRPSSPTTLRKSFSSGDIVLTWGRRTRLSQQWWLGNVPLGEESELFEVVIYSDSSFSSARRILLSSTPSVTYTSSQQIADFGSNQTVVNVRIYQMSGTVGRGHPLQQTI